MSTPYTPVSRRKDVIGAHIRPGTQPGGFVNGANFRRRREPGAVEIKAAANAVLQRRKNLDPKTLEQP